MADNNKDAGLAVVVGLLVTAAVAIQKTVEVAAPVIKPIVEKAGDAIDKKTTELRERIELPEIPTPNSHITLDVAKKWIIDRGLPVGETIVIPDISYKDCLEFEVVHMNYKPKQKVNPGTHIVLYYVTSDVIENSRCLQRELEANLAERAVRKTERKQKRAEAMIEARQKLINLVVMTNKNVKDGIAKVKKRSNDENASVGQIACKGEDGHE